MPAVAMPVVVVGLALVASRPVGAEDRASQSHARAAVVPHYAGTVIEYVPRPTGVSALEGNVIWNGADGIRLRDRSGAIRTVAPRSGAAGQELELGRDSSGGLATPVVRCSGARCAVRRLDLDAQAERVIAGTRQPRGLIRASIDGSRTAYTRAGRLYLANARRETETIALPVVRREDGRPVPPRDRRITDLDLRGTTIAAVIRFVLDDAIVDSQLWQLSPGKRPRFIARVGSGGGTTVEHALLDPVLSRSAVVVWRQHDQPGPRHNYLTRYSRAGRTLGRADLGRVEPENTVLTAASYDGGHLFYATQPLDRIAPCTSYGASPGESPGCPVVDAAGVRP